MQTNAIASNSRWFRANSCETSKHDWILMFTNWTLLQGYDSAWAPSGANGQGRMSENVVHDPKRIRIIGAIPGDTGEFNRHGLVVAGGRLMTEAV